MSSEERERAREAFFRQAEAAAERANLSEEEAESLVAEAVRAVRASKPSPTMDSPEDQG